MILIKFLWKLDNKKYNSQIILKLLFQYFFQIVIYWWLFSNWCSDPIKEQYWSIYFFIFITIYNITACTWLSSLFQQESKILGKGPVNFNFTFPSSLDIKFSSLTSLFDGHWFLYLLERWIRRILSFVPISFQIQCAIVIDDFCQAFLDRGIHVFRGDERDRFFLGLSNIFIEPRLLHFLFLLCF